jgi:hypothetical protein
VELYAKALQAVLSTPIPHAVESLGKRNGILLNSFDNPDEFNSNPFILIENEEQIESYVKKCFSMVMPQPKNTIPPLFDQSIERRYSYIQFPPQVDHIKNWTTGILHSSTSPTHPESLYIRR